MLPLYEGSLAGYTILLTLDEYGEPVLYTGGGSGGNATIVGPIGTDGGVLVESAEMDSWIMGPADSSPNTANVLTKPAETGKSFYVTGLEVSIRGGEPNSDIIVWLRSPGVAQYYKSCIGSGASRGSAICLQLCQPIKIGEEELVLEVDAGGAGVITTAQVYGYSK